MVNRGNCFKEVKIIAIKGKQLTAKYRLDYITMIKKSPTITNKKFCTCLDSFTQKSDHYLISLHNNNNSKSNINIT